MGQSATGHSRAWGAVVGTAGAAGVLLGGILTDSLGWEWVLWVNVPVAAIALRSKAPLVPLLIFRLRTLTGANVSGLLLGASLFSMFFFLSLYMQEVLGYSAIHTGLSYLPLSLTIFIAAGLGGQLVTRFGFKPILAIGAILISAGLFWFSQVSVGGGFLTDILGPSLLAGAGLSSRSSPQRSRASSGSRTGSRAWPAA